MMSLTAVTTSTRTVGSTACHHAMFLIQLLMFTCSHLYTCKFTVNKVHISPGYRGMYCPWWSHLYTCKFAVNKVHISPGYRGIYCPWWSHLYTCKYAVNKVHISPGYRGMYCSWVLKLHHYNTLLTMH